MLRINYDFWNREFVAKILNSSKLLPRIPDRSRLKELTTNRYDSVKNFTDYYSTTIPKLYQFVEIRGLCGIWAFSSGVVCPLYATLHIQRIAFFCTISNLCMWFLRALPHNKLPYINILNKGELVNYTEFEGDYEIITFGCIHDIHECTATNFVFFCTFSSLSLPMYNMLTGICGVDLNIHGCARSFK